MGDSASGLLMRLARDRTGNTLALIAASIFPLLAMIGGGVDMGRTYLTHTRLQQACDAGVLAARKKLGNSSATSLPADVQSVGDRFFGLNFGAGAFGTSNRSFTMTLNTDQSVAGAASVDVPTTIMQLFGYKSVSVRTSCSARLNFSNTDVMFVLDTTGSMADTNPGDSAPKIMILKSVVHDFVKQLNDTKSAGTRVRYGFVPYSTNVNVGTLLKSDWMVNQWTYQSRAPKLTGSGMASYYWVEYINLGGTHTTGSY
ncbi:MAG: Tad domain-containing protein, partial [Sphingomonadales bacterium]|nr:Tad domain-containing protein [Sphingomonadales bacterium]